MRRSIILASLLSSLCLGASVAQAASSYMVFAVDYKGAIGHGKSPSYSSARNFALSYCGQAGCRVVDVTKARCHAIAHSFHNGYWYGTGTAGDQGTTMSFALNYCSQNAPAYSCKISYKHCQ